jgi:hypothetical protein
VNTRYWVCGVLDKASAHLLAMEDEGLFPEELRVGSDVYQTFAQLRERDLARGVPLLVLGVELTEDPALTGDDFSLKP